MNVKHPLLIFILFNLGIQGAVLSWIVSCLSDRWQRVLVNGNFSRYASCTRDVPQRCVLGPILFSLYNRQIKSCRPDYMKSQEFADDNMIESTASDITIAAANLSVAVTSLSGWLSERELELNKQ